MARWEPNGRGRLEQSALELYLERGFEQTTVAEIAARAGLTERTFFRHFADKREVLFGGSGFLQDLLTGAVADAPDDVAPLDVVAGALEESGPFFDGRRDVVKQRRTIIAGNPELQERELIKLATLAAAMAGALRMRGISESAATLIAEAGIAAFRVAFERWVDGPMERDLAQCIRESFAELRQLTK